MSTDQSAGTRRPGGTQVAPGAREPARVRPTWRQRLNLWDARYSGYLYVAPFFVVFLVVGLFPLAYTAYVSLHEWSLIGGQGEYVGLQNYREVLDNPYFLKSLVNTFSIFLLSSVPQVVIALVLAGLLNTSLRAIFVIVLFAALLLPVSPVIFVLAAGVTGVVLRVWTEAGK